MDRKSQSGPAANTAVWPRTRWSIAAPAADQLEPLTTGLGLSKPLAAALWNRDIRSSEVAEPHLAPRLANLVPPDQLPGVVEAAARIRQALAADELILIFGDFDADGICASVVLAETITAIGGRVEVFLPRRLDEGYGLTVAALERAFAEHPTTGLVVTVDCGISQHEGCDFCRARGVDLVITDHHSLPETLPEATAIINPHLAGTPSGLKTLAGVGVAFKLAHMLARGDEGKHLFDIRRLLPIVALGTVADVVALRGENRILVHAGLALLNTNRHLGLLALKTAAGLKGIVTSSDLGFMLAPRINAAGRIGNPDLAVELLRTQDAARATEIANQLDQKNRERQTIERQAFDEAYETLMQEFEPERDFGIVVSHEEWHPGIVGLVAGRLCQQLQRPTVAICIDSSTGEARGSARCPELEGLDMLELLTDCEQLLLRYGGHRAAAGLSLAATDVTAFGTAFRAACAARLTGQDLRPMLDIDGWVESQELTVGFHEQISDALEPCGAGHPSPRWALQGVTLLQAPHPLGKEGRHFRLSFKSGTGEEFTGVMFNVDPAAMESFTTGDRMDIAFATQINTYWGDPELQLRLEDLRPC